ncbi:SDR family NAD(P)-dependent oxidoreductase [Streptomyces sp. NPDC047043]|uniref:SDR family NAD(P)-dependent oxidoreductase n=1 Tax=Streptomyces sp. NPDC047043 TaxID=3154497 RepID=UPI0033F0E91B
MSATGRNAPPVAVVTGAASGIGLELVRRLSRTHRVALLDVDGPAAGRAAAEIGGGALAVACDITDADSVAAAVRAVVERFGGIDVAVSNAGIGSAGAARHLDPDALARQLAVNVTGNWRFLHACLPHLEASRGYLLGVASAAALMAPPGESFYGASKAGLEALLDTLRTEIAHLGVDVGVAYLMFVDTPMVRQGDRDHPDLELMRRRLPGAAGRTIPVETAAGILARGVDRRAARIFVPGSLRTQYVLRGVIRSLMDRPLRRMAPELDALTAAKVRERGPYDAAFGRRPRADGQQAQDTGEAPTVRAPTRGS